MAKKTKSDSKQAKKGEEHEEKEVKEKIKEDVEEKKAADSKKSDPNPSKKINWKEKYMYLYADFDNYKKDNAKQYIKLISMAGEGVVRDFLPIVADFDRALSTDQKAGDKVRLEKEGVQIIYEKLFKVLQKQGLSAMQINQGDSFDPDRHQALTTVLVKDEKLKGKIVQIVEKGYLLHQKIIQVAKVIIGK